MIDNKKIYMYSDSVVCCAGKTSDGTLQENITDENYKQSFQNKIFDDKNYPVAIIPENLLKKTEGNLRINNIIDTMLYPIKKNIDDCINKYGKDRVGVIAGSCDNGSEESLIAHKSFFEKGNFPQEYKLDNQSPAPVAKYIASKFGLTDTVISVATACASSATALIEGAQLILADICDAVIVSGVDIVSPTVFMGFNSLEAVSPTGCNPFSVNRNGITLGEAGATIILCKDKPETDEYTVLLGYGETADANHMTAPIETGEGAINAMETAINMAKISKEDISYINLHGTGTPLNDAMESKAISTVFQNTKDVYVSSTKAITGHTLGAAGCLEISICMRILYDKKMKNKLPLHKWDKEQDFSIPKLNLIDITKKTQDCLICMSNSFAFGGCNVSIILGKDNANTYLKDKTYAIQ